MTLIYDTEAEDMVLGTLFGSAATKAHVAECVEALDDGDFTLENRVLFQTIKKLFIAGEPLDHPLTLLHRLRLDGTLDKIGGSPRLADLIHYAGSARSARHHIKTVRWAARLREWQSLQSEEMGTQADAERMAAQAQELLTELKTEAIHVPASLAKILTKELERLEADTSQRGWSSGLRKLDEVTGGFLPGQYVIVGGRTSHGKTSLLTQLAAVGASQGAKVLFISIEMTTRQVMHRILAQDASVPVQQLNNPSTLQEEAWPALTQSASKLSNYGVWIADGPFHIDTLIAKAKRVHAMVDGLDIIAVDYIQLVKGDGKTRTEEVGSVSRALKDLSSELGVCVLTAAQLSRAHEHDKREPRLADLRESGSLEHDADVVILIHRLSDDATVSTHETDLLVRKNRNGRIGRIATRFDAPFNRFDAA